MAAQLTSCRLARPMGLPDRTPSRRCRANMSGVHITGRRSIATHAHMHLGGQVPAGTPCVTQHQLRWRLVQPQPQHWPQRLSPAAVAPRRGHLLVAHCTFIDRISRLKKAYVEFYSDAVVSAAKDPAIALKEVLDFDADFDQVLDLASKVSSSSCEVTEHILQIGTEVIESEESTQYAEAASGFGKWKYVKDAAKRHPTRQETVDKLEQQLAHHESAKKILHETTSVMYWNMLKHGAQTLKNRMRAMQDLHGLALLEPTHGQALTVFDLGRKRAKVNEMIAAELGRHVSGRIDMAAEDVLEQRFPVMDDSDLQALQREDEI